MYRQRGAPAWFVFILSVSLVFGMYYLWLGVQTYLSTGGLGVEAATEQAVIVSTATAVQAATNAIPTRTLIPSFTPPPPCQAWVVTVPSAIVRAAASVDAPIITVFEGGTEVCVIDRIPNTLWYQVDARPETRRIDEGYMRGDIIRPINPTATPTLSPTPLPTVTPITPTLTPTSAPTHTPDPDASPSATLTPSPTHTPSPTLIPTQPPVRSI